MSEIPSSRRPSLVKSQLSLEDVSNQIILLRFDMNDRMDAFHGELSTMRAVLQDHIPRMTAVEKKTHPAKKVGIYAAVAAAVPVFLQILAEVKPHLDGPIQTLIGFFRQ